jgi:hypothetical protein
MSKVLATKVPATVVTKAATRVGGRGGAKPESSHSESLRAANALYHEHNAKITRAQQAAPLAIVREHLAAASAILEAFAKARGRATP